MVNEGRGRLFKRKDGKFLIYLPKDLAEDSMFPFHCPESMYVKVSFKLGDNKMLVETYKEPKPEPTLTTQRPNRKGEQPTTAKEQ